VSDAVAAPGYDGLTASALASRLALPRVVLFDAVESTMDEAHALAGRGTPAGTLVLANAQRAGRGRGGRRWSSAPGSGIWMTLVERPNDPHALDVLSLRVGIRAARALDRFVPAPIGLKWPNDLHLLGGKLGGILVETRWREGRPDWVAIGLGINLLTPADVPDAAALGVTASRVDVLGELVPAVRAAAAARGPLTQREVSEFGRRDVAAGRACRLPRPGRVAGIAEDGALLVVTAAGPVKCREGSLVLEGDPA
jgi:BirA family biotin operon repressor/biotin-[acetyl-CoA-carboxylase] ligase